MSDAPGNLLQTPADRLNAAIEAFNRENRMLPPGVPPQTLDLQKVEAVGGFDALIRLLIAQGILDEQAFVEAKVTRMAEVVEAVLDNLRHLKRDAVGLVVAGAMPRGNGAI